MHDLSHFRNNFELLAQRLATRAGVPNLDQFRDLDRKRRAAITEAEQLKAQLNRESPKIGELKRAGVDTTAQQEQLRSIKAEIAARDELVKTADAEFQELLTGIPNVPHDS